MVIEITSPSTARRDKVEKFNKYEQAGIKEYWIVEPSEKTVSVYTLQENDRFGKAGMYTEEDQVKVAIFKDLVIDLRMVFRSNNNVQTEPSATYIEVYSPFPFLKKSTMKGPG